jgi:hypothetical protein
VDGAGFHIGNGNTSVGAPSYASLPAQRRVHAGAQKPNSYQFSDLALHLGRRYGGLKLEELGRATGVGSDASVATCLKRYEKRLRADEAEQRICRQAIGLLKC